MANLPCLCTGRSGIRCDEQHCDLAGPGEPGNPNQCRVCWLRFRPSTRANPTHRSIPCLYLGGVVDKLGCHCPAKWLRHCDIHKVCNLDQCKSCLDYEAI